jgi:hypothetical protein
MEQLKSQLDRAIEDFNLNSELRKEVFYKIRELNTKLKEYEAKSEKLAKVIQGYKDMIACGDLNLTPGFSKLTKDEQKIIVKGMDKKDYTIYIPTISRFCDLEKLVQEVLDFKSKYPNWILKSITKSESVKENIYLQDQIILPKNNYKFTYMSPHGHYFTIGDIEQTEN